MKSILNFGNSIIKFLRNKKNSIMCDGTFDVRASALTKGYNNGNQIEGGDARYYILK